MLRFRTAMCILAGLTDLSPGSLTRLAAAAPAQIDCAKCHASLTVRKKVVHAAVQMGCESCHSGIAGVPKVPHQNTTNIAKGLSAEQPQLCYGCHDKGPFSKKTVHAAVGMGCTSCHDPHASQFERLLSAKYGELCYQCHDKTMFTKKTVHAAIGMGCTGCHSPHSHKNEKLLIAAIPDLCFNCHDKGEFSRKNVHAAIDMGCQTCHTPHSTDNPGLLVKGPYELCLDCHDAVKKSPHAIAGFGKTGHPLGRLKKSVKTKKKEPVMDPRREGRIFFCASCHNPHSSDSMKLYRYPAKSSMELCAHCHKM